MKKETKKGKQTNVYCKVRDKHTADGVKVGDFFL